MFYGETKKGTISVTEGQTKKHFSQFKPVEKAFLVKTLKTIKTIRLSKHLKEKDISIDEQLIKVAVKTGNYSIVEYNERTYTNSVSKRVLGRIKKPVNVHLKDKGLTACNLCFVIDIKTGVVITAYYNEANDNHTSINFNRYNENLKIIK